MSENTARTIMCLIEDIALKALGDSYGRSDGDKILIAALHEIRQIVIGC